MEQRYFGLGICAKDATAFAVANDESQKFPKFAFQSEQSMLTQGAVRLKKFFAVLFYLVLIVMYVREFTESVNSLFFNPPVQKQVQTIKEVNMGKNYIAFYTTPAGTSKVDSPETHSI